MYYKFMTLKVKKELEFLSEVKDPTGQMGLVCKNGAKECEGCICCKSASEVYYCPVCGNEPEEVIYMTDNEIVGCDMCIKTVCITDIY